MRFEHIKQFVILLPIIMILSCAGSQQCLSESETPEVALPTGNFSTLQTTNIELSVDSIIITTDTVIVRIIGPDGRIWRLSYAIGEK